MFVIQREIPNLYKGCKVILEDGTEKIPSWKRFNGFRIVDVGAVQNEAEKRKDDNGPMKKNETRKKRKISRM